jgi:flagellar hook-length control protein FliK
MAAVPAPALPEKTQSNAPEAQGNFVPVAASGAAPGASGAVRVTAATRSQASSPTTQQSILSQVDGSIRWLLKNKDKAAELQLHPESLGRVQIKIQVEGGEVHAKVWASEASALPLLQGHKAFLEVSLQNQGLTLGSFDLQHGQKGNETPTPAPQPAPTVAQAAGEPGQESPTAPAPLTANPHRIEIVA